MTPAQRTTGPEDLLKTTLQAWFLMLTIIAFFSWEGRFWSVRDRVTLMTGLCNATLFARCVWNSSGTLMAGVAWNGFLLATRPWHPSRCVSPTAVDIIAITQAMGIVGTTFLGAVWKIRRRPCVDSPPLPR